MNKEYVYKWFSGQNFKGVLSPVVSKFSLSEEINTAGSQIEIELGKSFDDSNPVQITDLIVDEGGDLIVTEQNIGIIVGTDVSISGFPSLNDRIEVWEHSTDYPNGILKFNGLVSKFSSNYLTASTKITVLSYGVQLDNYLVQVAAGDTLISNENTDGQEILYAQGSKTPNNVIAGAGQTFTIGTDTEVTGISVNLGNPGGFSVQTTVQIVEGTPLTPGSVIGSITRNVPPQGDTLTAFTFASPVSLSASTQYYFSVVNDMVGTPGTNTVSVATDSTGSFSGGAMYLYNDSSGWSVTAYDMSFELTSSSGGIGNQYLSYDPGAIARDLMDNFISLGGNLAYDTSTVSLTGTTVSYTFKFSTYLEAIKKCVELSPANWWWRTDVATGEVYFRQLGQSPDHTLTVGKHIENIEISSSLETVDNTVYYSGGDDGTGQNVLVDDSDSNSVSRYGVWLKAISDNRVTLESTASILAGAHLTQYKDPRYMTTVTIPSTSFDFNLISVGDIIAFNNGNDFLNSVQLQVMSRRETPDLLTLVLDILPPTVSKRVEDIKRNLQKEQTINNPEL